MTSYKLEVNNSSAASCSGVASRPEQWRRRIARSGPMLGFELIRCNPSVPDGHRGPGWRCAGMRWGLRLRKLELWNSFFGFSIIRSFLLLVALPLGAVTIYFQFNRAIGGEEIPIGKLVAAPGERSFCIAFYSIALSGLSISWASTRMATGIPSVRHPAHSARPAARAGKYLILDSGHPGLAIAGLLAFCWLASDGNMARALLVRWGVTSSRFCPSSVW